MCDATVFSPSSRQTLSPVPNSQGEAVPARQRPGRALWGRRPPKNNRRDSFCSFNLCYCHSFIILFHSVVLLCGIYAHYTQTKQVWHLGCVWGRVGGVNLSLFFFNSYVLYVQVQWEEFDLQTWRTRSYLDESQTNKKISQWAFVLFHVVSLLVSYGSKCMCGGGGEEEEKKKGLEVWSSYTQFSLSLIIIIFISSSCHGSFVRPAWRCMSVVYI